MTMTMTMTTCSDACWYAREDVCRCNCGGKNHGVLRSGKGEQPARTRRVKHARYELIAVFGGGEDSESEARDYIMGRLEDMGVERARGKAWNANISNEWSSRENPFRYSPATESNVRAWPELSAYRDDDGDARTWWRRRPYCVWKRI